MNTEHSALDRSSQRKVEKLAFTTNSQLLIFLTIIKVALTTHYEALHYLAQVLAQ